MDETPVVKVSFRSRINRFPPFWGKSKERVCFFFVDCCLDCLEGFVRLVCLTRSRCRSPQN